MAQSSLLVGVALFVFIIVSLALGFYFFQRTENTSIKVALLYVLWLILIIVPVYFFVASLAGVSMAVADGAISGSSLRNIEVRETFRLLLPSQLCIVPWILGAGWLLRRLIPSTNLAK